MFQRFVHHFTTLVCITATFCTIAGLSLQAQPQSAPTTGPEQDCAAALPIVDTSFFQPNIYRGLGRTQDLSDGSCLGREGNSVWYKITPQVSGKIGFTIDPLNPNDDYDWAVYYVPTWQTWQNALREPRTFEISCNFSPTTGKTGPNGTKQDGVASSPFNDLFTAEGGATYYIVVNNSSVPTAGYRINFVNFSPALPPAITVSQENAPRIVSAVTEQNVCSINTIGVTFSEYVRCSTVQADDFIVTDPDGKRIRVESVASARCNASANNFDFAYTLTLAEAASRAGAYTVSIASSSIIALTGLAVQGSVTHNVNLTVLSPRIITQGTPIERLTADTTAFICPGASTSLDAGGGYVRYRWTTSASSTTAISESRFLTVSSPGRYFVTVSDKNGCVGQTFATIHVRTNSVTPRLWSRVSYFCNNGSALIGVLDNYASYRWSTGETSQNITVNKAGQYTVTVRDFGGCEGTAFISIEKLTNTDLTTTITTPSNKFEFCEGSLLPLEVSQAFEEFQWFFNGDTIRTRGNSYGIIATQPGVYKVRVKVNGCTFESQPVTVRRNPLPATPVITQRGNLLISTEARSYQWSSVATVSNNTTAIVSVGGAFSREFIPRTDGKYLVTISDGNGCAVTSEQVEFKRVTGRATLEAGMVSGEQASIIEIPVYLRNASNIQETGATGFTAVMRVSAQLLAPAESRLEAALVNNERLIPITLPARPQNADGLLDKFKFRVLFGTTNASVVVLQSATAVPQGIGVSVTTATGRVTVRGEFIPLPTTASPDDGTLVAETSPNPTSGGAVDVSYQLPNNDTVTVLLTDAMGNTVETLVAARVMNAGKYNASVNAEKLRTGQYFIVVRTPSKSTATRLTVLR